MIHKYIEKLYSDGKDEEARRAIIREIQQSKMIDDSPQDYSPTEAEIQESINLYWASRREFAYGPIGRQLDMQFHGTWEAHVQAVKEQYPKIEM